MTPTLSVSQFVAVLNQSLEMILPEVNVRGELANLRISKNRWVYFDLKDEASSLKFFGSVSVLPGPLEDGMNLEVNGSPRLHNLYGFSVNVQGLSVIGQGSIAKAKTLLAKKLEAEGLFSQERKRNLPYPPQRVALVASVESAAYSDFIKIINQRWGNLSIEVFDCLVQGSNAPEQLVKAINSANQMPDPPEVLVMIRGGGSQDDLAAFSDERVVRAVSASRIPTVVAIGHERDISLAELAADQRASTPSNAAEILTPDKRSEQLALSIAGKTLRRNIDSIIGRQKQENQNSLDYLIQKLNTKVAQERQSLSQKTSLANSLNPKLPISKGFVLVRDQAGKQIKSIENVKIKDDLRLDFRDGKITSKVVKIYDKE